MIPGLISADARQRFRHWRRGRGILVPATPPTSGTPLLIYDDFNAVNATALSGRTPNRVNTPGNTWGVGGGSGAAYDIEQNAAHSTNATTAGTASHAYIDSGQTDISVEAYIRWENTNPNTQQGLILRRSDASNLWIARCIFLSASFLKFSLLKYVANSATEVATYTTVPPTTADVLKFVSSGNVLTVYLNGTSIMTTTDTFNNAATQVGLWSYGTTKAYWYRFKAWKAGLGTIPSTLNIPELLYLNSRSGNAVDEITVRAMLADKVYFTGHRQQRTSELNGLGHENTLTTYPSTELRTLAGDAEWNGVYDAANSKIFMVGQAWDAGASCLRACATAIDVANDTVSTYLMGVASHRTDDANELIALLDDGVNLVAGERAGGGASAQSDYPNGGGLWTIPKSTIDTPSTYTRVYEDTASPTRQWQSLVKRGSTYYNFLDNYTNGAWAIQSSADLATWGAEVSDSPGINDVRGWLIHHRFLDYLVAASGNDSHQVRIDIYNGSAWSDQALSEVTFPTTGSVYLNLLEFGAGALLFVGVGWGGWPSPANYFKLYYLDDLTGTPSPTLLYTGYHGSTPGQCVVSGHDLYIGTSYNGALLKMTISR